MIVDSLMHRDVVTMPATDSVLAGARLMRERKVGSIVVTAPEGAIGIVTEGDLARKVLAEARDPATTLLSAIMSTPIATIEPSAQIEEAAQLMRRLGVKRLVVALEGEVRGIITVTDIAYAEPSLTSSLLEGWVKQRWQD